MNQLPLSHHLLTPTTRITFNIGIKHINKLCNHIHKYMSKTLVLNCYKFKYREAVGRTYRTLFPSVSDVDSQFITINVTSNISHKTTFNLPNVQAMKFTTLSKPQNRKISSMYVQIIMVTCRIWPSSYLYITQEY